MKSIIYAPNVHHGGGLVLLSALCENWPEQTPCIAFLDERAAGRLTIPQTWEVVWIARSFLSRLRAEIALTRRSAEASLIFCFHNLPPVFACRAPVLCYVHNPVLVGISDPSAFTGWVRMRLVIERFLARMFQKNVDYYAVQTPTMAAALRRRLTGASGALGPPILQMPFVDPHSLPAPAASKTAARTWDFIYVSDGQAHKNHKRLFEAWLLLSDHGLRPSLAVTLHSQHDSALIADLAAMIAKHDLNIVNLGHMRHAEVLACYQQAGAMIFASFAESFGVPFLEARAARLPILAAELDFVRDMCEPAEAFDPYSPVSIARAVERYLGKQEKPLNPLDPVKFIDCLLAFQNAPKGKHAAQQVASLGGDRP